VKPDSIHICTETVSIFQEILRAQSDAGALMQFDHRPMALPYPYGRRLEVASSHASRKPFQLRDAASKQECNAQLTCHLLGGGLRETDTSRDTIAYTFQKTRLDGDPGEADGAQSLCRSGTGRPEFIHVATYLQKVIPRRQSYICRLVKGTSIKVEMVRLELKLSSIGQGHRSTIELQ
jgi:hypothetical protein